MNNRKGSYAWWIVFGGFILMSSVGIIVNCVSIFFKPVITSMGFSRTDFSLYFTITTLSTMIVAPFIGKIISRYNIRLVVTICCLLAGMSYLGYSQCTSLGQFYGLSILVGAGFAGISTLPVSMMITNWFIEKRGLAMAIAFAGSGIGGMVYNPITNWVILHYGWQTAYKLLGCLIILTILPVALFIIRAHPDEKGQLPYGAKTADQTLGTGNPVGLSLGQFVKTSAFWLLGLGSLLIAIINLGVQLHIPAYLTDLGYSSTFAANIVALFMGVLVIGKLVLGSVLDKFGSKAGMVYIGIMYILAVLAFMGAKTYALVFLFAILFGLGNAMATIPVPFITAEIAGPKDYGVIYGVINIFFTVGMSLGMPLSGAIFDATHSYLPAWRLYAIIAVTVMILLVLAVKQGKDLLGKAGD